MKRELLQNVKVQPYTSGDAFERTGFLSAVVGAKIGTAGALTLTLSHSDDGTTFEAVKDELVFPEKKTTDGAYTTDELKKDDVVNIDIDLVGLKDFVKITASGAAATGSTLALALGDSRVQSV